MCRIRGGEVDIRGANNRAGLNPRCRAGHPVHRCNRIDKIHRSNFLMEHHKTNRNRYNPTLSLRGRQELILYIEH
jgi:hypothetical protein